MSGKRCVIATDTHSIRKKKLHKVEKKQMKEIALGRLSENNAVIFL